MNNSGITLVDVRNEAMETIKQLKAGTMDIKTAAEIRNLLGVVVDTAKTQVEFVKAIPKNVAEQMTPTQIRAISGTLKDRDADRDEAITNSDERNSIQKFVDETY